MSPHCGCEDLFFAKKDLFLLFVWEKKLHYTKLLPIFEWNYIMSKIKEITVSVVALSLFVLTSCSSNYAKISGQFSAQNETTIYLEQLSPTVEIVDSCKLSRTGGFSFKYNFNRNEPKFFNVRVGGNYVTLLVEPGERVMLNGFCDLTNSLVVTGSKGSELLNELNNSMNDTYVKIDNLSSSLAMEYDPVKRSTISDSIAHLYVAQKQKNIRFIIENSTSLVSVYALYQQMPNGMLMFGDQKDFHYFKLVADSLINYYPLSVYVRTLMEDVAQFENRNNIENLISANLQSSGASPDLSIEDMFGERKTLSELRGKSVMLYFTRSDVPNTPMINKELKDIYEAYASKGFEVYQVSLDVTKSQWVKSVTEQKLPWVNVNDFRGVNSPSVAIYNVTSIPTNYILDREGNIVGKNLWGNDLVKKIEGTL